MRVSRDHHVEHEGCYYSLPSEGAGQRVDIRLTENVLEVLMQGRRLGLHTVSKVHREVTTLDVQGPIGNLCVLEGEPLALANWAKHAAPSTRAMMLYQLGQRTDMTNGHRTTRRLRGLARDHGKPRFEEVCVYAIALNITMLSSVESIRFDSSKLPRQAFCDQPQYYAFHTTTSAAQATSGV